ncbi:MAG: TetR/AcrR family transcriptional regulator [Terricaulis sp.]
MPRRESAKAERRSRIVEAAAALVRETGFEDTAMTDIAARAGVSPATLYNLFQTKRAIFREVFDEDLARFTDKVRAASASGPTDRIFVAIDIAASLYRRNPKFYRAMAHALDTPLSRAISEPRRSFWEKMVRGAVDAGELRASTQPHLLGGVLTQIIRGHFLDWAAGEIGVERLAKETGYGFAVALYAHAAKATSLHVATRMEKLEHALARDGARRQRRGG